MGPAVAQVAADLTTTGECGWLDLTDLGLDRFDADGNSRLAPEPISLPFPEKVVRIVNGEIALRLRFPNSTPCATQRGGITRASTATTPRGDAITGLASTASSTSPSSIAS